MLGRKLIQIAFTTSTNRAAPMPNSDLQFGVVILAAGASSRMGQPKQLLPIAGDALVIRAAKAALDSSAWPVVVVLGANAEKIRPLLVR